MVNDTNRGDAFVSDADDLAALRGQRHLNGDLIIGGTGLEQLADLEELRSVEGSLSITSNPKLTQLQGLAGLEAIGNDLRIEFNPALADLAGLKNLTRIGGYASISNNGALSNLDGLAGLRSIGGYLSIIGNPALETVALPVLSKVEGGLVVRHNPALRSRRGVDEIVARCALENAIIQIEERPQLEPSPPSKPLAESALALHGWEQTPLPLIAGPALRAVLEEAGTEGKGGRLELWKDADNAMYFHVAITPSQAGEPAKIKVDIMELWQKLVQLLG